VEWRWKIPCVVCAGRRRSCHVTCSLFAGLFGVSGVCALSGLECRLFFTRTLSQIMHNSGWVRLLFRLTTFGVQFGLALWAKFGILGTRSSLIVEWQMCLRCSLRCKLRYGLGFMQNLVFLISRILVGF